MNPFSRIDEIIDVAFPLALVAIVVVALGFIVASVWSFL
jgi:hypothetical protein